MQQSESQGFFGKLATWIVDKRKIILILYVIALAFCAVSRGWVKVCDDITAYLPETTETRRGLTVMENEFVTYGTARVMISQTTPDRAERLADELRGIEGVFSVEFDEIGGDWKGSDALLSVTFDGPESDATVQQAMDAVREAAAPYDAYISTTIGVSMADTLDSEMQVILVIAAVIIVAVLTLTSRSYAEVPVLILTFAAAALLNMGTNFLCGEISFVSNSVSVVLQLALAIDYAIILLHRFTEERRTHADREACILALAASIPAIASSSLTTISGMAAMMFMQFRIGFDLGLVLIKAICFSMLSVFTLMPALLMLFAPLLAKTAHRELIPRIDAWGRFVVKLRFLGVPVFVALAAVGFFLSSDCPFGYGETLLKTMRQNDTQIAQQRIDETFGTQNIMAVLVPKGDHAAEAQLLDALESHPEVDYAMGLANTEAIGGYVLTDALTPRELAEAAGMDYELMSAVYALYATENDSPESLANLAGYRVPMMDLLLFLCDKADSGAVTLDADLDLTGCDFTGLPVFSGHFDGQGHTISGLALGGGSVQGFFRYLEGSAVVENLHLQGTAGGTDATIQGLLAGENRGLVRGCSASGQVEAAQEAGGLVGRNEASGQLINCRNHAAVQADRMAGGVAGQNLGSIVRCQNDAAVNTALPEAADRLVGIDLSGSDGAALASVSDIGGIAGRSGGILQSCENNGAVGYASVGDNVGGIVGRTSGYLDGCVNNGAVQGSRDVGGVAGQLEPVLAVQYDGGKLDTLYNELDALQAEMDALLTNMGTSGDSVSAALSTLTEATRTAKDSTGALADGMVDWADGGIAAINSTASRLSWAIDQLTPVFDDIGTAMDQADAAGAALKQFLQDAAAAAELGEDARAQLQTAAEAFAAARQAARAALTQVRAALQALQNALGSDSESQAAWQTLADALASLRAAAGQVQDAAGALHDLLGSLGTATEPADRPQELETLYQALLAYQQARNTMLQARETIRSQLAGGSPDLGAILTAAGSGLEAAVQAAAATSEMLAALDTLAASITPQEIEALRARIETLQAETEAFRAALEQVRTAAEALQGQMQTAESALSAAWEELRAAAEELSTAADSLRAGFDALAAAADALQPALDAAGETLPADLAALKAPLQALSQTLQSAVAKIGQITDGLAGQPSVSVPSLDSAVGEEGDALNAALGTLLDGFAALNTAVSTAGDTLTGSLRAVNDRLGRVTDAVRDLTSSAGSDEETARFADVSREQAEQLLQQQGDGCLVNAANTGEVTGDSRVGGVVGSLANELDTDPAGHWQQQGEGSTLSAEVQLRLIVLDSRNSGAVTAKKEQAGGVAGRMDFGYTADCENTGDVAGASQVGGIVGQSAGILERCWARCALTGSEDVGGIAGYGGEITGCRTMVELLPGEGDSPIRYAGAIAGRVAEDAALADNQYIHETLGAVDGVTRAAEALPASFEALASDPAAPDGFARLALTFVADGKTVATVTFRYGEGVTSLPAVPQKDGYVGQWPDMDYTCLTYSQTVEAEYTPYASALAGDSGETPQVLVDGSFSPQAKVSVATAETSFTDADGRTHSGTAYTVTVTDPVFGAPDCTVHFRKPDTAARYTVWAQQGENWAEQKPGVDGSYLLIDCPGGQITFLAEVTTANVWLVLLLAAAILLAAAVFVIIWCKRTRKPRPRQPENAR